MCNESCEMCRQGKCGTEECRCQESGGNSEKSLVFVTNDFSENENKNKNKKKETAYGRNA